MKHGTQLNTTEDANFSVMYQDTQEQFLTNLEQNKGILYKIANSYCRIPAEREDLIQEMILQLCRAYPKYSPQFKFSTWMYRVALNVAISFYRRERKRQDIMAVPDFAILHVAADTTDHVQQENINALYHFIGQLKELERALMLLYLDDKSHKEIAEILGISETNVATKIHRIKSKLKQKFSNLNNHS